MYIIINHHHFKPYNPFIVQNLNDIFRSQKLLKTVNNDIHTLKLIHKVWLRIIERPLKNEPVNNVINPIILEQCLPTSIRQNILNLSCESSLIANHMRFIEDIILQEILDNGIKNITKLNIIVMPKEFQQNTIEANPNTNRLIDKETINTLEDFTLSCTSETLRSSTERLLKQFKKNTKNY